MTVQVLLVDDEPAFLRAVQRALARLFRVRTAQSSQDAFGLLARGTRFDAIVCDVRLPDLDGGSLFDVVEREWPEQAQRVIFLTAHDGCPESRRLIADGHCILVKPCSIPRLTEEILRVVTRLGHNGNASDVSPVSDESPPASGERIRPSHSAASRWGRRRWVLARR